MFHENYILGDNIGKDWSVKFAKVAEDYEENQNLHESINTYRPNKI